MRGEKRYWIMVTAFMALGLPLLRPVSAQQPAVTGQTLAASAAADQAQWENVVLVMKDELARAESRASSLTDQLIALDNDIESRVDRMISLLASVRDSSEGPGNRIRKAKESALAGIKATAVYYAQERDRRMKALENATPQVDEDMLAREVAALNARIETRVTQSIAIATSLVQQGEEPTGRYRNEDTDYSGETPEHRKMRYDAQASVKIKADLVAVLRSGIDKQTREIAMRDDALRSATDPQKREQLQKDNEFARQIIAARRAQIEELVTATGPATRAVSGKAAFEMDKLLDDMTAELRRDFAKFKTLVNECADARARVKPLRDRLAQAVAAADLETAKSEPSKKANETK
jgi:hypothetical protein